MQIIVSFINIPLKIQNRLYMTMIRSIIYDKRFVLLLTLYFLRKKKISML